MDYVIFTLIALAIILGIVFLRKRKKNDALKLQQVQNRVNETRISEMRDSKLSTYENGTLPRRATTTRAALPNPSRRTSRSARNDSGSSYLDGTPLYYSTDESYRNTSYDSGDSGRHSTDSGYSSGSSSYSSDSGSSSSGSSSSSD